MSSLQQSEFQEMLLQDGERRQPRVHLEVVEPLQQEEEVVVPQLGV